MNAPVKKDGTGKYACPKCFKAVPSMDQVGVASYDATNQAITALQARVEAVEKFINVAANVDGKVDGVKNYVEATIDPTLQNHENRLVALAGDITALTDLMAAASKAATKGKAPAAGNQT
jgi:hypothetical protein